MKNKKTENEDWCSYKFPQKLLRITATGLVTTLSGLERSVLAPQIIYFLDQLDIFAHDAAAFILMQLPANKAFSFRTKVEKGDTLQHRITTKATQNTERRQQDGTRTCL
jgi:hypothetical protein